jgi:hypothetical protein
MDFIPIAVDIIHDSLTIKEDHSTVNESSLEMALVL